MDKAGELREISAKEGEITTTIRVEVIENGFIVCERKCGYKTPQDKKDYKNYFEEEKKYFSESNPLVIEDAIKKDKKNDKSKNAEEEKEGNNLIESLKTFMSNLHTVKIYK